MYNYKNSISLMLMAFFALTFYACEQAEIIPDQDFDLEERRAHNGNDAEKIAFPGETTTLGDGYLQTYAYGKKNGIPKEIGIRFSASMLDNLPTEHSDQSHCYDLNENGTYELGECFMSHERVLALPAEIQAYTPFKWALVNWNPYGHLPDGVYNVPHFDVHFYIQPLEERNDIKTGPCLNLMNCDDLATALNPIPPQYVPQNYFYPPDGGTVEPAMGGHMINTQSPEICCGTPFTHTFIHGAYDGKVTFYEPMVTRDFLLSKTKVEQDIFLPEAWEEEGYYPTRYEIKYHCNDDTYTVSMTKFKYREGS